MEVGQYIDALERVTGDENRSLCLSRVDFTRGVGRTFQNP
jgi:hypothetical protein